MSIAPGNINSDLNRLSDVIISVPQATDKQWEDLHLKSRKNLETVYDYDRPFALVEEKRLNEDQVYQILIYIGRGRDQEWHRTILRRTT